MSFLRSSLTQTLRAPLRTAIAQRTAVRSLATTPLRFSEHHQPLIQGDGSKPGEIASDEQQSTGLERFELMGKLQGIDVFNMEPLDASRLGTKANPIKVQSMATQQIVGCTGFPAESHEAVWLTLSTDRKQARCPQCGSVYEHEYLGTEDHH